MTLPAVLACLHAMHNEDQNNKDISTDDSNSSRQKSGRQDFAILTAQHSTAQPNLETKYSTALCSKAWRSTA